MRALVAQAPSLSSALYSHEWFMAQSGRTLVCDVDRNNRSDEALIVVLAL